MNRRGNSLTLIWPQPLTVTAIWLSVDTSRVGNSIGRTNAVNQMVRDVRTTAMSFANVLWMKFGWFTIRSTAYVVPSAPVKRRAPTTTRTFRGTEYWPCVQWAAVSRNRRPIMDPPQKWFVPLLLRSDAWCGNWPRNASWPPTIRTSFDWVANVPAMSTNKYKKSDMLWYNDG